MFEATIGHVTGESYRAGPAACRGGIRREAAGHGRLCSRGSRPCWMRRRLHRENCRGFNGTRFIRNDGRGSRCGRVFLWKRANRVGNRFRRSTRHRRYRTRFVHSICDSRVCERVLWRWSRCHGYRRSCINRTCFVYGACLRCDVRRLGGRCLLNDRSGRRRWTRRRRSRHYRPRRRVCLDQSDLIQRTHDSRGRLSRLDDRRWLRISRWLCAQAHSCGAGLLRELTASGLV